VWALWAVAAGAVVAHLVENHAPDLALSGETWRTGFRALATVLVVATAMYGAFAVTNHFSGTAYVNPQAHPDDPTLDGLRFAQEDHPDEWPAIRWFDSLEGQPNIVTAPGRGSEMYGWANPISSLTGVPTLAGWAHEVGYRGGDVYRTRLDHVDTIYTGAPDERAYYLDTYEVAYVYVGPKERSAYGPDVHEEFAAMDFQWENEPADPQDPQTFESAKLTWSWPDGTFQGQLRHLYQDLLLARQGWGALREHDHTTAHLVDIEGDDKEPASQAMILERGPETRLIAVANLADRERPAPKVDIGERVRLLSTAQQRYGGPRPDASTDEDTGPLPDRLGPWEAVVMGPAEWASP